MDAGVKSVFLPFKSNMEWMQHFSVLGPTGGREPARPPTSVSAPRDLVTSEVTARSFRVTWTPAPGQVEKYRVVYYPASGGQPDEKVLRLFHFSES